MSHLGWPCFVIPGRVIFMDFMLLHLFVASGLLIVS